jgi:DNA-binding transcriptional ArsR family regulator
VAAQLETDGSTIWRALADPTRRGILDLLRDQPRTTGDIASRFPVSRIAVMRHLGVLASAGLVSNRKRGRERWHYLNAVPLQRIHERWVSESAEGWASGLVRLGRRVGEGRGAVSAGALAIDVALDIPIAGTPERVFAALTEDVGGWWGHPYVRSDATGLTLERRLGGLLVEAWGSSGGTVLATVTGWSDDEYLQLTGPFHLGVAVGVATFRIAAAAHGTDLQFAFQAMGAVVADMAEAFAGGWTDLVERRLKAFVETGARLGIAPDPPK